VQIAMGMPNLALAAVGVEQSCMPIPGPALFVEQPSDPLGTEQVRMWGQAVGIAFDDAAEAAGALGFGSGCGAVVKGVHPVREADK
jgi:hypothetical protein